MKNLKKYLDKFILILLLGVSIMVSGQIDPPSYFSKEKPVNLFTGVTYSSVDIDKTIIGTALNEKTTSAKLYLRLDLGDDYVTTDGTFSYDIQFTVTANNTSFNNTYNLLITEDKPEGIIEIDLGNEFITMSPNGISITNMIVLQNSSTGAVTPNYLANNIRLTSTFIREFGVDVRSTSNTMAVPVQLLTSTSSPGSVGRIIEFIWQTNGTDNFPNYEIQVLRLYNTDENNATNNSGIKAEVDWNKALRVETQSHEQSMKLTMAEGTGFYICRIRPIGNFFPGGIANQENHGLWNNSSLTQGALVSLDQVNVLTRTDAFYFTDPDQDVNWIYNRVFTEGNSNPLNSGVKVINNVESNFILNSLSEL